MAIEVRPTKPEEYRAAGRERDEIARRFQHGQNPTGVETAPMPH